MNELFDNTSTRRSAVISADGVFRYRLDRDVAARGIVIAYFGINGSTADALVNDQTVKKLIVFTQFNGGRKFIIGNPFGYRAQDVNLLAGAADPVGLDNAQHLAEIIAAADLLVPCWGRRAKVPERLHTQIDALRTQIFASRKPVRVFGFTASGDPIHPLMLPYSRPLQVWEGAA